MSRAAAKAKTCARCLSPLAHNDPGLICWTCFVKSQREPKVGERVSVVGEGRRMLASQGSCVRHNRRGCMCEEGKG